MRTRTRPPSHPGSILKLHYLDPSGISVTDLAKNLRLSRKKVSKILNERGAVTTDVALRLSRAFDTTPELWLNLQRNYDLWHTANETTDWQTISPILKIAHVNALRYLCLPEREFRVTLKRLPASNGIHYGLLPSSSYFANLAFSLYYRKIPSGGSPLVLNFMMLFLFLFFWK
jgi:antitoxin HigA-1